MSNSNPGTVYMVTNEAPYEGKHLVGVFYTETLANEAMIAVAKQNKLTGCNDFKAVLEEIIMDHTRLQ